MGHLLDITLFGLAAGMLGTSIGGCMAFFIKKVNPRFISMILEFSAGLMTAVVCFELIPEGLELGGTFVTFAGVFAGIFIIVLLENYLMKIQTLKPGTGNAGLLRAGMLTATGIALHNFPEGFAVGAGFEASFTLGMTLTLVIIIHDIPEGIAMAVPMKAGGFSATKAFFLTVLSGAPMGLGALLGALFGEISEGIIAACLGFAGGAMLYIVCGELVPQSKRLYQGRLPSLGNVMGILCGILITIYN